MQTLNPCKSDTYPLVIVKLYLNKTITFIYNKIFKIPFATKDEQKNAHFHVVFILERFLTKSVYPCQVIN